MTSTTAPAIRSTHHQTLRIFARRIRISPGSTTPANYRMPQNIIQLSYPRPPCSTLSPLALVDHPHAQPSPPVPVSSPHYAFPTPPIFPPIFTHSLTNSSVEITSPSFQSKPQPARHRMVYALLKDEMEQQGGIHALQLRTKTPEEEKRLKAKSSPPS